MTKKTSNAKKAVGIIMIILGIIVMLGVLGVGVFVDVFRSFIPPGTFLTPVLIVFALVSLGIIILGIKLVV